MAFLASNGRRPLHVRSVAGAIAILLVCSSCVRAADSAADGCPDMDKKDDQKAGGEKITTVGLNLVDTEQGKQILVHRKYPSVCKAGLTMKLTPTSDPADFHLLDYVQCRPVADGKYAWYAKLRDRNDVGEYKLSDDVFSKPFQISCTRVTEDLKPETTSLSTIQQQFDRVDKENEQTKIYAILVACLIPLILLPAQCFYLYCYDGVKKKVVEKRKKKKPVVEAANAELVIGSKKETVAGGGETQVGGGAETVVG
ncbi:hypothetical protein PMAYCL1PPCAC_14496 [Pristionchus mayeri]|uniref:Uncharacterized protein n=1 Tax=Pristionchus mayeri TaxID=1317129 RepID=A0AAN5CHH6_9BILA|nr:hypothetical protein PMAYCL1PPCAC_14496 [Pristionchus mayeri]